MDFNQIKINSKSNGYIALMTMLILSIVVLLVGIGFSINTFTSRNAEANRLFKEQSYFLALSCIDRAILKIALNPLYRGEETITIKENTCYIKRITLGKGTAGVRFESTATIAKHTTNLTVETDTNLNIVIFIEK